MNVVFFEIAGIIGVFFGIGANIRLLGKSLGWDEAIVYVGAVFRDPGNQRLTIPRSVLWDRTSFVSSVLFLRISCTSIPGCIL